MHYEDKGFNNLDVIFTVLLTNIVTAIQLTILLLPNIIIGLFTPDGQ